MVGLEILYTVLFFYFLTDNIRQCKYNLVSNKFTQHSTVKHFEIITRTCIGIKKNKKNCPRSMYMNKITKIKVSKVWYLFYSRENGMRNTIRKK